MEESTTKSTRKKSLTLPLIMIIFSLVITIPSFFWMTVTLHPFMTEIQPQMPNLGKAELMLDHIDLYVNPLSNKEVNHQVFSSLESNSFTSMKTDELSEPYNRFARPVSGFYSGDSMISNLDPGNLTNSLEEWIRGTISKQGKGHKTIKGDSQIIFARAKILNDTIRFSGIHIELDKYLAALNVLVDSALSSTVFNQFFDVEKLHAGTDNTSMSTPFYLEIVTDNDILYSRGIKDPGHSTKYTSKTLWFLEDVELVVYTPLNVETMIRRAISNIKKTSLFAIILFFFGFVLLLRRKKLHDTR